MNILNWFKKEKPFDIKTLEEKIPVGSWYKSGSGIARLSNIYLVNNKPLITVEKPLRLGMGEGFHMDKDDNLSPSYLDGWTKVTGKEAEKLERSYWKIIERDLSTRTKRAKVFYDDFMKAGTK